MSEPYQTRAFEIADYDAAVRLWQSVEGVEIAEGDSREEIAEFVRLNPGLSRVATAGGELVGVALCGHDGHRGHIYHLAVDPSCQRTGLGQRLVRECLDGLRETGMKRAIILVATDNPAGRSFWLRAGWEELPEAAAMGIDL